MKLPGKDLALPPFPRGLEDGLQNRPHRYVAGGFGALVLASAGVGLEVLPMWLWVLVAVVAMLAVLIGGLVMYSKRTHPAFSG